MKTLVVNNGAPGAIRTPDPLIRSQILYPAELRARMLETVYIKGLCELQAVFDQTAQQRRTHT